MGRQKDTDSSPKKSSKSAGKNKKGSKSVLARAREVGKKALKNDSWLVKLDPDMLTESLPHLSTGSVIIDYLIGGEPNAKGVPPCPGLPKSRVTQLWGHESAGKTTLALTAAATTCQAGGTVLYVDWEFDIVPDYAAALGVPIDDPDSFELVQPETLEEGIKLAMIYALSGVSLIIFDSVGAAVPARIANRDVEDVGEQARVGELQAVWSQELPNLKKAINRKGGCILGISQTRAKISTGGYGGPTTQPQGGNAWKFYSSVRMELRRIKSEKTKEHNALTHKVEDRVTGGVIKAKMVKCKMSKSQGREEVFYIRWGEGIDDIRSIMEIAAGHKIIQKAGSWISWTPPGGEVIKVQGTERLRTKLKEDPKLFEQLYSQVRPYLTSEGSADSEEDGFSEFVDPLIAELEDLDVVVE